MTGSYLTDKTVIVEVKDYNNFELFDVIGNKIAGKADDLVNKLKNNYNLSMLFKRYPQELIENTKCDNYSLIIGKTETLDAFIDELVLTLRIVELIAAQTVYGKIYQQREINSLLLFDDLQKAIRDGHISAEGYDKIIKDNSKVDVALAHSLLSYFELLALGELVRSELAHSQSRLISAVHSLAEQLIYINSRGQLRECEEMVYISVLSDGIGWAIVDSIKALSTSLDALSKYIFYVSNLGLNKRAKIAAVYANDLERYQIQGTLVADSTIRKFKKLCAEVKPLILFRNEVTHNTSLYPVRLPVYVGYATQCVKRHRLAYSEVLSWDRSGNVFHRSNGRVGFFSQQNNAVNEVASWISKVVDLISESMKIAKLEAIDLARKEGLTMVTILERAEAEVTTFKAVDVLSLVVA